MSDRYIIDVINSLVKEVPKDARWAPLKSRLQYISNSAKYTAPEDMRRHWDDVAKALENHLGDPDEEWKRRIASIFGGRDSI